MTFDQIDRQRTACHEAAHAVILRVLSLPMTQVTINLGANGSGGLVSFPEADKDLLAMDRDALTNKALTVLAGPMGQEVLAEQELRRNPACGPDEKQFLDSTFHEGNRSDYEHAEVIVISLIPHVERGDQIGFDPAEAAKMLAKLERKTRRLIKRHRPAIVQVAKALLERGSLSGEQVDQIIAELAA